MHRYSIPLLVILASTTPAVAQESSSPIQRVVVVGAKALSTAEVTEIARTVLQGKQPEPSLLKTAFEAVRRAYQTRGFTLAQVTGYQLEPNGTLQLTVAEGRIRRIVYQGNKRTRASVLHEALSLTEGTVYQEALVREDRARLGRLGIFSDVLITGRVPEDTTISEELGQVDLVVKVKEAQTGNVAATVGYADQTGLVGFVNLSENNLLGTGQRLSAQWQRFGRVVLLSNGTFSQDPPRSAYNVSFEKPALGLKSTSYGVSAYDQNTIFLPTFGSPTETLRSYEQRKGGRGFIGRQLGSIWSVSLTGRHDQVGYDAIPARLNPPTSELNSAAATVGALGINLQADTRDRIDNPHQGYLNRLSVESAGSVLGGTRRFTQTTLDLRRYSPLAFPQKPGASLAVRAMGGFSEGSVPLSEQFFLGGFDLLRGYEFFSLRGDKMVLASVEARVPLGTDTAGVAFVDAGNAWRPGQAVQGLKSSVGVGLRFLSPFGPIRFDVAVGDQVRTYISLGQSF